MLEAFHPGCRHFARANGIGYVSLERNPLLPRFLRDRENRVAWNQRLQLDEIRAAALQIGDGAPPVFGGDDCN